MSTVCAPSVRPQLTIATATVFTHNFFVIKATLTTITSWRREHKVAADDKGSVGSREKLVLIAERTILHTLNYNFED
ncbi:hypothetical protein CYMTET_56719 [Cymbomonas tetramitiformis]|uniref:Uncharacterized protein n=1 Tax=Cymbomonas tetramitiformis TaxID=36881 RepID=A0AAE0BBI9_9CHLO|nr:hypothetical protein CYMTET_56719 [Cymbomonas tetramitiformis]